MPVKVSRADIGPRPFTRRVGPDGSAHRGSAGPLSRDRVLRAAVALAHDAGIESLTMRELAMELGVVPMALYKHVANKDELRARRDIASSAWRPPRREGKARSVIVRACIAMPSGGT